MDDTELEQYLPKKGDRLAARKHCQSTDGSKSQTLLDRLRNKFAKPAKNPQTRGAGNSNASKSVRHIEIGWLDYDKDLKCYKQVRSKNGGGNRNVTVSKSATKEDLIAIGTPFFFPNGYSKKGHTDGFHFSLRDFKQSNIADETVSELYKTCSMRTLRVYICTKLKSLEDSGSDSTLPNIVNSGSDSTLPNIVNSGSDSTLPNIVNSGSDSTLPNIMNPKKRQKVSSPINLEKNIEFTPQLTPQKIEAIQSSESNSVILDIHSADAQSSNKVVSSTLQKLVDNVTKGLDVDSSQPDNPVLSYLSDTNATIASNVSVDYETIISNLFPLHYRDGEVSFYVQPPNLCQETFQTSHTAMSKLPPFEQHLSEPGLSQTLLNPGDTNLFPAPILTPGPFSDLILCAGQNLSPIKHLDISQPSTTWSPVVNSTRTDKDVEKNTNIISTPESQVATQRITGNDVESIVTSTPEAEAENSTKITDVEQNISSPECQAETSTQTILDNDVEMNVSSSRESQAANATENIDNDNVAQNVISEVETYTGIQTTTLTIRRGNCLFDLINGFLNASVLNNEITIIRVLENGKKEEGEGIGVLTDCLVEFWGEFYERCTTGKDEKIPCLRHDFQEVQWMACARIFLFGWAHLKYIPVQLSSQFVKASIGRPCLSLTNSYLMSIGLDERETLRKALENYSSVEEDDILDVLDMHNCKRKPSAETLSVILEEIAHKELIQEPMFIIDCWKSVLEDSVFGKIEDRELMEVFEESVPTAKKVLKRLVFNVTKSTHDDTAAHLRRFIREADIPILKSFLRFCTGSDLLIPANKTIKVEFMEMSDFSRRPIGRTCSQTLQLGEQFNNYPEFRAELNGVLNSNVWVIDYV